MSENKEFLANFIAEFQSKNQQKFVEMRSESPELLSAIENVLGFLKGKYELDTPIELVPESEIPIAVVEPTEAIQATKIRVGMISLSIKCYNGQVESLDSSFWTDSQNFLNYWIDKFGMGQFSEMANIYVSIIWENGFKFTMSVTIPDWFKAMRNGIGKWVESLLKSGINGDNQLLNQPFKNYDDLAFEDTLQTTTKSASTNVGEIPVLQINVDVDWVNGDLFTERFWKWENANEFLRDNFRSAGGYTGIKRIYLDIRWENGFVLKYPIIVPTWLSDIGTNFSEYLRKKIYSLADVNNEQNQSFREFDKLSFQDANVSQTQSVVTPNAPTTQPQPISGVNIKVSNIYVLVLSKIGQRYDQSFHTWNDAQEFVTQIVDNRLRLDNIDKIYVSVTWENNFEFRWTLDAISFFTDIKNDLSEYVENLVKIGLNLRQDQAFNKFDKLQFKDANVSQTQSVVIPNATKTQPQPILGGSIKVSTISVQVLSKRGQKFEQESKTWDSAQEAVTQIVGDRLSLDMIAYVDINVTWSNNFEFRWTLNTKSFFTDIKNDLSKFVETLVKDGLNLRNQSFKDYDKLSFQDANVSQTQNVKTSKSQPTLVNIQPTGNEIQLKSFVFTLEDSQKGIIEADGVLWSELNDIFQKSFERRTFQKLKIDVEWEDDFLVVETIYYDDIDAMEMLENTTSIGTFIYTNWTLFTTTQGKVRSNYAFSDFLPSITTPVASSPTKSGIVLLDTIEVYLHTTTSILPYEYKNFDEAAIEISRILKNSTLLDVEKVRVNVFWKDGSYIQFVFYKADNGYAYLKRNILKNPTALIRYTRQAFELRFPAEDMDNYEGLKITGRSTATITTPVTPTPPAKRGRPKKVQTASQSSTATTSTPKVKKKIDEVKTADDLIDLDLDNLEI